MDRAATFGVVGGTGSTGRAVASELQQSTGKSILIAGRNLSKAEAVAAQLGGTVSTIRLQASPGISESYPLTRSAALTRRGRGRLLRCLYR